ncbi:MAG: rod shape-determining protein MreD [Flavobacteriales bacterium]|jgi:hypothetical protein|nr:rod shape-determining protein MreD [Flavobacteriales bacterium]|tara:strand:- start:1288 stop:1788 length:501 start_codon:yes stop_codon:yes gene_type:complete
MNKKIIKYIFMLPIYLIIQIYILNEILFASYINPYIYLIILIIMPYKIPKWFLLFYAFIIGFLIDLFSGTLGIHSSACLILVLLKSPISKITIPHNIIEETDELVMQKIGAKSFILFSFILVLIHHTILFILEHVALDFQILLKIIASTIITTIIISITQLFFFKS